MDKIILRTQLFLVFASVHVCLAQFVYDVTFVLSENSPADFHVGNIALETNLAENAAENERENIRFTYLKETKYSIYFTLDNVTSDLNTSSVVIDREKVCGFSVNCTMEFEIGATSGTYFAIISVKVIILDVNDNAPVFPSSHITLNISEGETVGTEFRIKGAYDADMWRNNSIQGHTIEQSDDLFDLIEPKRFNISYELRLRLKQHLDRENKNQYLLKIIARDGGNPIQTGMLNITINVLDDNDNAPEFASTVYDVSIDENIEPNTVFLTISASDKDAGSNGEISYRISDRQSNVDAIKEVFYVNETTGEISVVKKLVYEPTEIYNFIVEAIDHGEQPLENKTQVKVTVNDVENNPPTIDVSLLSSTNIGFVEIAENVTIGHFVAHVSVDDTDRGLNGDITCGIEDNSFKLETFPGRGFKVVVNDHLDRESKDSYNVIITCVDGGTPKLTSSASFTVLITDVNDNAPVFDKDVFTANIGENGKVGEFVTRVIASDADTGPNGQIEYILAPESSTQFKINKHNGTIYSNVSFDRELQSLIAIRVFAVDHGEGKKTATAVVSVTVTDLNDNAPKIIPVRPEFRVMENSEPNLSVGFIKAKDDDEGRNGKFKIEITPVSKTFPFTIDAGGEIKTTEMLDREQQSRYDIPVTVTDFGVTALSSTQYITIYVGDVNDNEPRVTFPNDLNDTVKFLYPVQGYNVVTTVAAYDVDEGENCTLAFSIINGNDMDIFEIDSRLGEVSVKSFIDIKADMTVSLLIQVEDKGLIPQSTQVNLKVDLIYANATDGNSSSDSSGNKNVIIVIVVVITTVAIAIAIIVTILFLRSMDPRKRHAPEDESGRYSDSGISSRSDSQSLPAEVDAADDSKAKKRKEVSFSLEFSMDGLDCGRNNESTTDDIYKQIAHPPPNPRPSAYTQPQQPQFSVQKQEKIDSHMKALKLQQYLWEAKSRDWEHTDLQQLPLDSESETSRETVTCDSGRGGSEDDVSTTSPTIDEKKRFSFTKDIPKRVTFFPQQLNHHYTPHFPPPLKESTPVNTEPHSYGPQSFRNQNHDSLLIHSGSPSKLGLNKTHHSNTYIPTPNTLIPKFPINSSENWRGYHHRTEMDPARMRHDSFSSVRSNEDDGGSTTTSGSYTLDPDEIETEMMANYGHLVV